MKPSIGGSNPLIPHNNRPPDDTTAITAPLGESDGLVMQNESELGIPNGIHLSHMGGGSPITQENPGNLLIAQDNDSRPQDSTPKGRKNGSCRSATGYGTHWGLGGLKIQNMRSIRREKINRRYSPSFRT
ncbi:hypothetical protein R6Q59_024827 [Mikania micrantha]